MVLAAAALTMVVSVLGAPVGVGPGHDHDHRPGFARPAGAQSDR